MRVWVRFRSAKFCLLEVSVADDYIYRLNYILQIFAQGVQSFLYCILFKCINVVIGIDLYTSTIIFETLLYSDKVDFGLLKHNLKMANKKQQMLDIDPADELKFTGMEYTVIFTFYMYVCWCTI